METNLTNLGFFARLRAGLAGARRGLAEAQLARANEMVEVVADEEAEKDVFFDLATQSLMGLGPASSPSFGALRPGSRDD